MNFKVILIKNNASDLEKLLTQGWRVAQAFPHPQGSLIALAKNKEIKRNGR